MCAVVNYLTGAHRRTSFRIIKTHPIATTNDVLRIYYVAAQGVNGNLPNLVLWQFTYKIGLMAVVGKANCNVSFPSTRDDKKMIGLHKAGITFGRQAKHNLA